MFGLQVVRVQLADRDSQGEREVIGQRWLDFMDSPAMDDEARRARLMADEVIALGPALADQLGGALAGNDPAARRQALAAAMAC
jgi:hypothetical protein